MAETHFEEFLYLAGLGHEKALIAWGGFYFRRGDSPYGHWRLLDDDELAPRTGTIGAGSEPFGDATVEVERDGRVVATAETGEHNHVWVTGLEPDAEYRYRVLVDGRPWGEGERHDWSVEEATLVEAGGRYDNRFRTFPSPDASATVEFAVLGDFGVGIVDGDLEALRQLQLARALERAVDTRDVRLVLTTGDNVYLGDAGTGNEDDEWYSSFYQPYRYVLNRVPFFPTVGNHDAGDTESSDDRDQLADNLFLDHRFRPEVETGSASLDPGLFYRFQVGANLEFICIDTSIATGMDVEHYFDDPAHARWVEEALRGPGARWRIPFSHHPPFCAGPEHGNTTGMVERLVPLFEEGGVRLVLSGHEHNFQHSVVNGIHYVVSGAAGRLRTEPPRNFAPAGTRAWAAAGHLLLGRADEHAVIVRPLDGELEPIEAAGPDGLPADPTIEVRGDHRRPHGLTNTGTRVAGVRPLLHEVADLAADWLDSLPDRPVRSDHTPAEMRVTDTLGDGPLPVGEVIAELAREAAPGLTAMNSPRFFGFVIGGAHPAGIAADWLAAAWDQNAGLAAPTPAVAAFEEVAGRWLADLLGLPPTASFALVTGCQMAHVTALAAARQRVLADAGHDVNADGLVGAPPIRVLAGAEHHVTVERALRLLGLGTASVEPVPADERGAIRALPALDDRPTIVIAQVGNVNGGAIDPMEDICAAAHEAGAWVHVDGAFGLWAAASPARRHLVRGVAQADSWATDAHKWLNVPYDCGLAFVRDREAHRAAMSLAASYLVHQEGGPRDPMDWTPEFSRRARGLAVYATLRALGRDGVAELVDRLCACAERFADRLAGNGFEILQQELNQVVVACHTDEATEATLAAVQAEGTCYPTGTTWRGRRCIRISVSNWQTTTEDVDRSIAAMAAARALA